MNSKIRVGRRLIQITHPDKLMFPVPGYTKYDLVSYYADIAEHMMPLIHNHPIVMQRFPHDSAHQGFFHKDAPDYFPAWIKRTDVRNQDESITSYVVSTQKAVVPYLATQGCVTPHAWLSRADALDRPDRLIFDLDPGVASFSLVRKAALIIRDHLQQYGLHAYVMTTGSQGMHVVTPLRRLYTFDQIRVCAKHVARILVDQHPELFTIQIRKEKRGKRIFIDYLRNSFGATAVAPYAVRARAHAPVATPIDWDEVEDKTLTSQRYTIATVMKRLENKGDPWKLFYSRARSISSILKDYIRYNKHQEKLQEADE